MGKLHFENVSRLCLYAVYTIIIYTCATHLYCMGVKIHYNKYFDGEELVTIFKISLQRCTCECNAKQNRCLSVNYKRTFTSCRLNVNKSHTPEELSDKPGSVYVEMDNDISGCDNYKIAAYTDNSVVPFKQPACGKPRAKANATTLGNVYSNGSRIKYVCNERFKQLYQTESVTVCLHNESWSQINFTCKPDTIGKSCSGNLECLEQLSECKKDRCVCSGNHSYSLAEYACVPTDTIGKSCSSKLECLEQLSECKEGRCVCSPNHSYSLAEYACVPKPLGCGNCLISNSSVIPNGHFNASSIFKNGNESCDPWLARLHSEDSSEHCGCWADSDSKDKEQYIQVNLSNVHSVRAVTTKGRSRSTNIQLVKSYKVLSSIDGFSFHPVLNASDTNHMIFPGNVENEPNKSVTNELQCPIQAQYMRINPQEWQDHISLRFDVIGCTLYSADCDFENGTCGWQHKESSLIQWKLGQPNNTEGGPPSDHTCGGGKCLADQVTGSYMYITANQQEHVTAQITVNIRESNVSRCLSLWHTASNNFSGSLNVITAKCEHGIEKLRNTTKTNFPQMWNMSTVRVESGVYQIVIEGAWSNTSRGILAMDDIKLNETDCI